MARCAAAASASPSGCLAKYTAVSSSFVFRRFGASSRQVRHIVQVVSTYQAPGAFSGCLAFLSAIAWFLLDVGTVRNLFERSCALQRRWPRRAPVQHQRCGNGITLGSISGSAGESIGEGDGVGVGSGVSSSPPCVVNTPPEMVTSSTR